MEVVGPRLCSSSVSRPRALPAWAPAQLIIKKPLLVFFPDLSCEFVFHRDFVGQKCVWRGRVGGSGLAGSLHTRGSKTFASKEVLSP